MIYYDHNGMPLPPGYVPPQDDYLNQMTAPFEQPPADPNTPPVIGSAGGPSNYLGRKPTADDPYGGINTTGPMAQKFKGIADDYRAGVDQYEDAVGQGMPQQYGVAEPMGRDEGPLSPEETAARMPTNKDAMDKLIRQHMLPMAPKASRDGYDNYVTASRQKRAAEKAHLREQGALNRADAAEKDQAAYDQTLRLNAVQGAGPGGGGGYSTSFGGGGPSVSRIGGYSFVRGMWRPQTPEEQAQTGLMNAKAQNERTKPMIEMADISSRRGIAESAQRARAEENEADRRARADEAGKNRALTEGNQKADNLRADEKMFGEMGKEMDELVSQLRSREGSPDRDTDPTRLMPNPEDPSGQVPLKIKGSYRSLSERAVALARILSDAYKKNRYNRVPNPDVLKFLEKLDAEQRAMEEIANAETVTPEMMKRLTGY